MSLRGWLDSETRAVFYWSPGQGARHREEPDMRDNLGVEIAPTDIVMVTAWGDGARLVDTGRKSPVVRFNRTRVVIIDVDNCERAVTPSTVQVLRRDGAAGFEGNR